MEQVLTAEQKEANFREAEKRYLSDEAVKSRREAYRRTKARGVVKKWGTPSAWTKTHKFAGTRSKVRAMKLRTKRDNLPPSKQGGGYTGTTTQLSNKKIVPQKRSSR